MVSYFIHCKSGLHVARFLWRNGNVFTNQQRRARQIQKRYRDEFLTCVFGWNIFVNDKSAADISKDILRTVATRKARLHIKVGLYQENHSMFGVMSAGAVADNMIYHTDCDIPRVYRGYLLE